MSVGSLAIYILLASTMGSFARAQDQNAPPPERLTLPVLLQLVAERSPKLAVEQVAIDAAKADRITAGALLNPTVSYGHLSHPAAQTPCLRAPASNRRLWIFHS